MGVLKACRPREDIIKGHFNPEIFTASLSEVLDYYRSGSARINSIYTDAQQFFKEATYPTDGLKAVLSEVFLRLKGDNTVPAIHRLETAFGGGKTHTLIACTHIAYKGKEIADVASSILDPGLMPVPGEITVVGISGDAIPVHKPKGERLIPYTLWGEIAFQVGGEALYKELEEIVTSYAAPGDIYFERVLKGKKALIMMDELAQYAARLACAHPGGSEQLAAFLMSLHRFARTNSHIAVVLTLASATDAFAKQTEHLARVLSKVTGKEMDTDDAIAIGQEALKGVSSVVSRDASLFVPVQPAEISRVLGKRLFQYIDQEAARTTAAEYGELYLKNKSLLPELATRHEYLDMMVAHYPFHPTLIDFLNKKLAASEEFQGTRGVLRVLSLTVRSLWEKDQDVPMIHACHLDLRNARLVNEIIGRTGSGDLLPVLNADIGGVDTSSIEGGHSNAELCDMKNPHPEGWPMYEYTWKTVFLHSLVERDKGLSSNIFGLTEQEALFNCCFPGLSPAQVKTALKEIENSAYYLRFTDGRYYASLEPSVNIVLARIRKGLTDEEINELLSIFARKVVSSDIQTFKVVHDVSAPEHIPDRQGIPVLALVSLLAGEIDVDECVKTAGPNRPRTEQNLVFLLVPDTVSAFLGTLRRDKPDIFKKEHTSQEKAIFKLKELARTVLSMRRLNEQPESHGISSGKLDKGNFKRRFREREKALETAVTQVYNSLWFPSASGQIVKKEIRTAGGESGASVIEQIRKVLLDEGELVTSEHTGLSHLQGLKRLFFANSDTVSLKKIRENFCRIRKWPILKSPDVLDQIIRAGVERGVWCLFLMEREDAVKPDEFYSQEKGPVPLNLDLARDYSLVTVEGAKKRGWLGGKGPDLTKVMDWLRKELYEHEKMSMAELIQELRERYGEIPEKVIKEKFSELCKEEKVVAARQRKEGQPEVFYGPRAAMYVPVEQDIIMTPKKAVVSGLITSNQKDVFELSGKSGANKIIPILRRLGAIYSRGAKSAIDLLDIYDLKLPHGGKLRLTLENAGPETMKDLDEFFDVLANVVEKDDATGADLTIEEPKEDCLLLKELKKDPETKKE